MAIKKKNAVIEVIYFLFFLYGNKEYKIIKADKNKHSE